MRVGSVSVREPWTDLGEQRVPTGASSTMITRRQIIESQRDLAGPSSRAPQVASGGEFKQRQTNDSGSSSKSKQAKQQDHYGRSGYQQIVEEVASESSRYAKGSNKSVSKQQQQQQQNYNQSSGEFQFSQQDRSRYEPASERDYESEMMRRGRQELAPEPAYRQFDPYSVYGDEEEDVWYSEDRLFEVSLGSRSRWPCNLQLG